MPGRPRSAPSLEIVTFLKDFNSKSRLSLCLAVPNPPRALKSLLFLKFFVEWKSILRRRQPSQNGQCLFFSVSGVGPFCEANPHRMAIAISFLFLASCHSVRAGVPFFTGRQPSQNGHCHFLSCFLCCAVLWGLASLFLRDANPRRMASAHFFSFGSRLISRPSEKSRMRCPDVRGREIWDWA